MDSEVQGVNLRAAVGILMAVCVNAALSVGLSIGRPGVGAALGGGGRRSHWGVDHQHHRHHTVATVGGRDGGRLHTGLSESHAVPNVGQFA